MAEALGMKALLSGNDSDNWCQIDPVCTVNASDIMPGEFGDGNSTDAACSVPFCPHVLSYSIKNSRWAIAT